jgi:EmrB/QacA subfamily drug resistance transporter
MSSRPATTPTTPTAPTAATTATTATAPTAPTADHGPSWPADEGHPRKWLILCVLAAVAFMAQLDLFIVNVAVPAMGRSFSGAGLSDLSWVLNAYAIVFGALLVPAGRLADHFGRRRFLLAGVVVFTAGSVLCAVAPTLDVLVLGRVVQAVGAASIVPASLGLLLPTFPARQHNLVVGAWAGVAAVAASSGAPLGGLLVTLSWRWIFLVNLPIGIFTVALGLRVLPEVRAHASARLPDTVSMLSLLAAVTLLIFGTVEGSTWGWTSPGVIASLAGAAAAGALTVRRAFTRDNAVVEADLFSSREFGTASAALFLFFIAFATLLLISVLYLQDMWHYSALDAGLGIAPGPLTAAVFAINSGRIATRFGRAVPALLGTSAMALSGLYWLLFATATPDYLVFLPGMILGGVGAGLTQAPLFASAATLAAARATTGSAVLNMARQVGSAVGVAVLVALIASQHPDRLGLFDRGWALQFGAATAAAAVVLVQGVLRPLRARRPETMPGPRVAPDGGVHT